MSRYIGTRPEIILQSIQLMPDAKNYHLKFCRKEIKRLRKIIQISSERLKKLEAFFQRHLCHFDFFLFLLLIHIFLQIIVGMIL
jgi:hypothetical protein